MGLGNLIATKAHNTITIVTNITKLTIVLGIMWFMGLIIVGGVCLAAILGIIQMLLSKLIPLPTNKEDPPWKQY